MALKDVEGFLTRYATDSNFKSLFDTKPGDALDAAKVTDAYERKILTDRNVHEIREYLKDLYVAALQVNIR